MKLVTSEINLADGETLIIRSPATLLVRPAATHSDGAFGSVGVPAPHINVRVGPGSGDRAVIEHERKPADDGVLFKTDVRVIYMGKDNEIEVTFADLVRWHREDSMLRIFAKRHAKPYVFALEGPGQELWEDQAAGRVVEDTDLHEPRDPGGDDGRQQPGFPHRILLDGPTQTVVFADSLLPFAAAYLDALTEERVETLVFAHAIGVSYERAKAMLLQLDALGHVGFAGEDTWMILDSDGRTVSPMSGDEASPPGISPDEGGRRQIARDTHDYAPDVDSEGAVRR